MKTVAIFGPGLIGGSLALALRERVPDIALVLWTRSELSAAKTAEVFPQVTCDPAAAAEASDLWVFCTPIGAMPDLARTIQPFATPATVVTDAGSVKAPVVDELEKVFGGAFVGSHPMAGSEKSGLAAARADLFAGATCVVTPTARSSETAVAAVDHLWSAVGGRLVHLPPAEHDQMVGLISHLPHAVAAVLVHAVADVPGVDSLAGGGYRDTSRIAAGPPGMWAEILLQNRGCLVDAIDGFTEKLTELRTILLSNDTAALENFLSRAKAARDALK